MFSRSTHFVIVLVVAFATSHCGTVQYTADKGKADVKMLALQKDLAKDPENAEVLRDLGTLHVQLNQHGLGSQYLQQAFDRDPDDPKTIFYLGLATEILGNRPTALRLYVKYVEVPRRSSYRGLLHGRYQLLTRELARAEIRQKLQFENSITEEQISSRRLAVFPLSFLGAPSRFGVLGKGIAEMLVTDLARVGDLDIVERIRLQALLSELSIPSDNVDPATAPRLGRLLGAGTLVGGNFDVLGDKEISVALAYWESLGTTGPTISNAADQLSNLFALEKKLVKQVLDDLGITPSPAVMAEINLVPTRDFEAFLAYSLGIDEEDRGNYSGAAQSYKQAVRLDPGFGLAAEKLEAVSDMEDAGADPETSLSDLVYSEFWANNDLLQQRLTTLNANLNASILPGSEGREVVAISSRLPDPPQPPSSGN